MKRAVEFDFRIDAFQPDTLPMGRLADYLLELAKLLGHKEHVHFDSVRQGSAALNYYVDDVAAPKVNARLELVGKVDAPEDIARAWKNLNDKLRDDNAVATLRRGSAEIIRFPGREIPKPEKIGPIKEHGMLEGVLYRIGGKDNTIHVHLLDVDENSWNCVCTPEIGRELGTHFLNVIRVFGEGRWVRNEEEKWELIKFEIEKFEGVDNVSLRDALERLRSVKGSDWERENRPLDLLRALRHGPDGGH